MMLSIFSWKKINSLIIDHHEINRPYPKANIIINQKKNSGYQNSAISAQVHLFIFFLEMLDKKMKCKL